MQGSARGATAKVASSRSAKIDSSEGYDAEAVTVDRLDAGGDLGTPHFRCARRAGTDARTAAVAVAAPDAAAPGARGGGRHVARRGGDPCAVSAQAGRPRERPGRGLPARRLGGLDWVGVLAGGDDVGRQRPGLRLLPYPARRCLYPDAGPGRGGSCCLPGCRAVGQHAGGPGPIARRRGRSTPQGGRPGGRVGPPHAVHRRPTFRA
jgi:hypothetical protein